MLQIIAHSWKTSYIRAFLAALSVIFYNVDAFVFIFANKIENDRVYYIDF